MKRLIYLALPCLLLAACSPTDPNEKLIQGKWMAAGDLGEGHSWYLEWTFNGGSFEMSGYPPIYQTGQYRVRASESDTITLELYNQEGDLSTDDRAITIVIDSANDQLTIDGQGPFSRTEE